MVLVDGVQVVHSLVVFSDLVRILTVQNSAVPFNSENRFRKESWALLVFLLRVYNLIVVPNDVANFVLPLR